MRANETYSEDKSQFKDRKRDVRMNVQLPHKWWPTLKSVVFSSSLSLPPLVGGGGGLGCVLVGKANLTISSPEICLSAAHVPPIS